MRRLCLITSFLLFSIHLRCDQAEELKVATYNIYFLDDGISQARKSHLRTVLQQLNADIIGFEEINNPTALRNILPGDYEIAMLDDSAEVQELALAVRSPLKIESYTYVFPDTGFDEAFPRKRDLLEVLVEGLGRKLVILVHHAKSRWGGRLATDRRREAAATHIMEHIRADLADKNVILLGDFNDNPDDRSLNILETGDPDVAGGVDESDDTFLFNTSERLVARDYCSYGYSYLIAEAMSDTFKLEVRGAREENNKWRDQEHDYFSDVQIKAILYDQILVSMNLKGHLLDTGVFNKAIAVQGEPSKVRFIEGKLHYSQRGSLASDHVPVWTVLSFD